MGMDIAFAIRYNIKNDRNGGGVINDRAGKNRDSSYGGMARASKRAWEKTGEA